MDDVPFPESLCHRCSAPPRLVTSARGSTFILCPRWPGKYPPQPVRTCPLFEPRPSPRGGDEGPEGDSGT